MEGSGFANDWVDAEFWHGFNIAFVILSDIATPLSSSHLFRRLTCSAWRTRLVFIIMAWKHCLSMAQSFATVKAVNKQYATMYKRKEKGRALFPLFVAYALGVHWINHYDK